MEEKYIEFFKQLTTRYKALKEHGKDIKFFDKAFENDLIIVKEVIKDKLYAIKDTKKCEKIISQYRETFDTLANAHKNAITQEEKDRTREEFMNFIKNDDEAFDAMFLKKEISGMFFSPCYGSIGMKKLLQEFLMLEEIDIFECYVVKGIGNIMSIAVNRPWWYELS